MPIQEKKLIRLSLIILCLSLLMVYLVLYQVKGKELKDDQLATAKIKTGTDIIIKTHSGDEKIIVKPDYEINTTLSDYEPNQKNLNTNAISNDNTNKKESEQNNKNFEKKELDVFQKTILEQTGSVQENIKNLSDIRILSGTKLFYGKIDAVDKLGIKYQYALVDGSGTYLIKLGTQKYDFESIARALGGNIYKITTEQELEKNKLFGNKVVYINLPEYKNKLVLMLQYIGQEIRLIHIDYKIYHKSKGYLKSLFMQ